MEDGMEDVDLLFPDLNLPYSMDTPDLEKVIGEPNFDNVMINENIEVYKPEVVQQRNSLRGQLTSRHPLVLKIKNEKTATKENGGGSKSQRPLAKNKSSSEPELNLSKNALAARENRQKKKQYIQELEEAKLKNETEIQMLKSTVGTQKEQIMSLDKEVNYLRNVLGNVPQIKALLPRIKGTANLNVKTTLKTGSLGKKKNKKLEGSQDHQYSSPAKRKRSSPSCSSTSSVDESQLQPKVGVCLHVAGNDIALVFCPKCNTDAQQLWGNEDDD